MTDEGFREVQLTGKKLVFLGMVGAVVLVVIFLLGVMVGRGVPARNAVDVIAKGAMRAAPSNAECKKRYIVHLLLNGSN